MWVNICFFYLFCDFGLSVFLSLWEGERNENGVLANSRWNGGECGLSPGRWMCAFYILTPAFCGDVVRVRFCMACTSNDLCNSRLGVTSDL
jgi:hypothetical protein